MLTQKPLQHIVQQPTLHNYLHNYALHMNTFLYFLYICLSLNIMCKSVHTHIHTHGIRMKSSVFLYSQKVKVFKNPMKEPPVMKISFGG